MSQAISVAFYIIAFTEAFEFLFNFVADEFGFTLPHQLISIPATIGLAFLIIKKGANVGVKALYFVIGILFVSILMFFLGKTEHAMTTEFSILTAELRNRESFFVVQ